ncbi:MAG TPA: M48 family metallopeptidase [Vicinamibacterales bacterium]|jgi:STE24 endopeptidase|nr:M48 family metallopeptidase [Vicinamibacterales bacterium]
MNEDRATRYHRLKRQAGIVSLAWSVLLLVGLLWTGWAIAVRTGAESIATHVGPASWQPGLAVISYVILLSLLNEIGGLPIDFYRGFVVERRYELSNQKIGSWLVDEVKSYGLGVILGCGAASLTYWLIRLSPDRWWFPAGVVFALLILMMTNLAPVLLLPLFYRVKPLENPVLCLRLVSLAERAGARVVGAYEWGMGAKTKKANAALTGLGRTRRILISDTMLAEYSEDEIEVVLAHELGHHVHGDIWKGIVFECALILAGFYLAARLLSGLAASIGLRGSADVAGLPLLLLAAGAVSFVMMPFAHAMSRRLERHADRFALDLTRNPAAFISAMRRLAAQNLAEERPSRLVQWLFYSHPPILERIAAARAFPDGQGG